LQKYDLKFRSIIEAMNRIYIGKIGALKANDLYPVVQKYGNVVDFLMKDTYAFVEYSNENEAKNALIELDGRVING